ncbi:hypothetical protein PENSPDRAFT_695756 [Peniophora sp. CONT]|nr:hypothetical protein PENSPDRAFT_695756 [Peniophora sp. CONT]
MACEFSKGSGVGSTQIIAGASNDGSVHTARLSGYHHINNLNGYENGPHHHRAAVFDT